ncbi:MAG TPA: hypothetical protein VME44_23745 [Streptosporangiaceae bacterium]|nr:hypothetical protein [Streptosporangiaceae bacterium]
MAGKGLGWRTGGIVTLTAVTVWTYFLYYLAEERVKRISEEARITPLEPQASQLHQHVCQSDDYWKYLRDLLAELAEVAEAGVLTGPAIQPTTSTDLGQGFIQAEKMMREWLDHLTPPYSRYVVYYLSGESMQASSEVHNGWKGRPPDLQRDSLRRDILTTLAKLGRWVVLPDVEQLTPEDEEYLPLCFDRVRYQSFASLPLKVEEPVPRNNVQQNGLAVGVLIIESPGANEISVDFCRTAVLTACDILALAFASAWSSFSKGQIDAKR